MNKNNYSSFSLQIESSKNKYKCATGTSDRKEKCHKRKPQSESTKVWDVEESVLYLEKYVSVCMHTLQSSITRTKNFKLMRQVSQRKMRGGRIREKSHGGGKDQTKFSMSLCTSHLPGTMTKSKGEYNQMNCLLGDVLI